MKQLFILAVLVSVLFYDAQGQTTSFTYQGNLVNSGSPANGNYDFEFLLFDSATNGAQVGSTLSRNGVPVINGSFSVDLDYGNQFPGANRFLEIHVRVAGGGGFTPLSPRQQINSSPYSIKSTSAENAANATTAANALQLGGIAANQFVVTGDARLSDARNPLPGSTNYIQNGTAQQSASSFNISGNGTAGGSLSGSVVNAATQFNINNARILSNGGLGNLFSGVGAGTANNTGTNNTFVGFNAGNSNMSSSFNVFVGTASGFVNTGSANTFVGSGAGNANTSGNANVFSGSSAGQFNTLGIQNSFFGANTGNTNTQGNANSLFGFSSDLGANGLTNATGIGSHAFVTQSNSLVLGGISGVNNCTLAFSCNDTNVGIGTTAPTQRLHVVGNGLFTGNLTVNGNLNAPSLAGQFIQNSNVQQPTSTFNISGNGTVGGTLSGNVVNSASLFNISGNIVFRIPGTGNTFGGVNTGPVNPTGTSNTFFGNSAGAGSDASSNSFFGFGAGYANTGSSNSYFGDNAGGSGTQAHSGSGNAFFGSRTGWTITTGIDNTFLGTQAGMGTGTGQFNVMVGFSTGQNNTSGNGNTFVGLSGVSNQTGGYNSLLGYNTDLGGPAFFRSTAIGFGARVDQSDSIVIGGVAGTNGVATDPFVGIGTTNPSAEGGARFTVVQRVPNSFAQIVKTTGLSSGASYGLDIRAGTSQSDVALDIYDQAVSNEMFVVRGDGRVGMGFNRSSLGTARVNIDDASTALYAHSSNGYGVYGVSVNNIGVYGSGPIYGGYFEGNVRGTGQGRFNRVFIEAFDFAAGLGGTELPLCTNGTTARANLINLCGASSLRYKKHVRPLHDGLSVVARLRPVSFDWKGDGTRDLGLVAEEVNNVEPLLAFRNKDNVVQGVRYDRVGVVLINAVKEQQAEIESLKEQVKSQGEVIAEMKTLLCKRNARSPVCKK